MLKMLISNLKFEEKNEIPTKENIKRLQDNSIEELTEIVDDLKEFGHW